MRLFLTSDEQPKPCHVHNRAVPAAVLRHRLSGSRGQPVGWPLHTEQVQNDCGSLNASNMCKAVPRNCIFLVLLLLMVLVILLITLPVLTQPSSAVQRRSASVLDSVPLTDGHNDLPNNLWEQLQNNASLFNMSVDHSDDPSWNCSACHTDLPRLRRGKVGAQFWVAYVKCNSQNKDAVARTLEQIDVTKRLIASYPNDLQFVSTADGIHKTYENGKIASLLAVEGGHSIDSRLSVLRLFYDLGVRYLTLTHICNTPWATSSSSDKYNISTTGLSQFGKVVIKEMNRLGMMIDLSHTAYQTQLDVLNTSAAPIIFSHSSAFGICPHHRNVRDDILRIVGEKQGLVMVNFYSDFIQCNKSKKATIEDVVDHINYIRNISGVDSIGIGGDFDGITKTPTGLEDVSKYPDLFNRLAKPDKPGELEWTHEDLTKLAYGNMYRVFKEVEMVRDRMTAEGIPASEVFLPIEDRLNLNCISELAEKMDIVL